MSGMRAQLVQAHIAWISPAEKRRQQAALHTRSMGGDIPTSVVQEQQAAQRRRRRNGALRSEVVPADTANTVQSSVRGYYPKK